MDEENIKKGGPYTVDEKYKRREKVYQYYFDYGYSARKIAEILNVNRNTINRDINYLFSKIDKKTNKIDRVNIVIESIETLGVQKTRLRENLDKVEESEKMAIEKLILQVDTKMIQLKMKFLDVSKQLMEDAVDLVNEILEKNQKDGRVISNEQFFACSEKAHEKIKKIIKEDKRY